MLQIRAAVIAGLCLSRCASRAFSQAPEAAAFGSIDAVRGDSVGGEGIILRKRGKRGKHDEIDSVVIWLHGLGDTAEGWFDPMAMLAADHPQTRFILPTAPSRPVTMNNGFVMPAWMDIVGLPVSKASPDHEPPVDEAGLDQSAQRVLRIVEHQIKQGVPRNRVIIGGFSQGGAVALHTAMSFDVIDAADGKKHPPAIATIACSTWLPLASKYPTKMKETSRDIRVLQCHGDEDMVVRRDWGRFT